MTSIRVVETVDVITEIFDRVVSRPVLAPMNPLALQRAEEALHRSVVVAIAPATHARASAGEFQPPLVLVGGVLTASVRVVNQAGLGVSPLQRLLECRQSQVPVDSLGCVPGDDSARVQVHESG